LFGGSTFTVTRLGLDGSVGLNFSTRPRIISRMGSEANPLPKPSTTDHIVFVGCIM
jgi:hypothetical protein